MRVAAALRTLCAGLLVARCAGRDMSCAATRDFYFRSVGSDRGLAQNTRHRVGPGCRRASSGSARKAGCIVTTASAIHLFRHDPRDPASLPDSYVTALAVEGGDALWVGTYSEFVARLDLRDGRIQRFAIVAAPHAGLARKQRARAVAGGRVVVGRHAAGLVRLDPKTRPQRPTC